MPIIQKPSSSSSSATGIVQLPDTARMVDPTQLSNSVLTDLGFDPLNLPNPFSYPNGMSVSLIDHNGTPTLFPTDQTSNVDNFIGFLKGSVLSTAQSVPVLSIRGSKVSIFGDVGLVFASGDQLFLSTVAGRVTNNAPTVGGVTLVRVGFCYSSSEFIINSDQTGKIF